MLHRGLEDRLNDVAELLGRVQPQGRSLWRQEHWHAVVDLEHGRALGAHRQDGGRLERLAEGECSRHLRVALLVTLLALFRPLPDIVQGREHERSVPRSCVYIGGRLVSLRSPIWRCIADDMSIVVVAIPDEHWHLGLAGLPPLVEAVEEHDASPGIQQAPPEAAALQALHASIKGAAAAAERVIVLGPLRKRRDQAPTHRANLPGDRSAANAVRGSLYVLVRVQGAAPHNGHVASRRQVILRPQALPATYPRATRNLAAALCGHRHGAAAAHRAV
mmetsp:Transcript_15233/g.39251  ORF Transcript_15233/g.39251 Transcript_15233/m.39251 type:complete len:276 (+) Transcript_15233:380-1207(+)